MTDDEIMEIWSQLCRDQKNLGKNIAVALARLIEQRAIERCAEVCKEQKLVHWVTPGWERAVDYCAAAIRALKEGE